MATANVSGATRWRVLVSPTDDAELATLVAAALEAQGRDAVVSRDAPPDSVRSTGVRMVQVNYGTYGMASTVRWMQPADHHALLVTVDPAAVEAEPVPNGFVFADEQRGVWQQVDRVWDVAPSPDWTQLAYGKAFVLQNGEKEITDQQWRDLALKLAPTVGANLFPREDNASRVVSLQRELAAHRFASSGMAIAYGIGITFVKRVSAIPLSADGATRAQGDQVIGDAVALAGWRTRWTPRGDMIGIGVAPKGSQDYSPPSSWILGAPRAGGGAPPVGHVTDSSRFVPAAWTQGPTLDISVAVDLAAPDSLLAGRVRSAGGWIRARRADGTSRIIGPGRILAATANARYIAALAPRPGAAQYETPVVTVVYEVR